MGLNNILEKISSKTGQLALLIDPDKIHLKANLISSLIKAEEAKFEYIFVGGSNCNGEHFKATVKTIKQNTALPVILFPGDNKQISKEADALLYLTLLSGRNTKYLIEQHIESAFKINELKIEIIPTGYILIDGGNKTSVVKVSETTPIENNNIELALKTSLAGIFQGKKIIYLDAGSGAKKTIKNELIKEYKKIIKAPLIVGGGIKTTKKIIKLKKLGVNIIVVGNYLENNPHFFEEIKLIQTIE
jgi:phosphoglycerol geranylgeranyltransferase